MLVILFLTEFF